MDQTVTIPTRHEDQPTSVVLLHGLLRMGRIVRHRWQYLVISMAVTGLLAGFYYLTATRTYEAKAQLLVQETGPVVVANGAPQSTQQQGMLPTYERLFISTVVLEGAAARLSNLPREMRIDLAELPPNRWVDGIRERLSVRSFRLTNVIEISYRSKTPSAAEAVVAAVVDSYLAFMKENHQSVAEELVVILHNERKEVERQLAEKERLLLEAKRSFGDLGLRDSSKSLHPLVQRVIRLNETLIEAQRQRIQLQSTLAAINDNQQRGGDLRHHLLSVEPLLGQEVVLAALGLSKQDSETVARLEQKLIDDQTELRRLRPHYGNSHPDVRHLLESVRKTEVYLANYQQTVDERLERIQGQQWRKTLISLVEQQLDKAQKQEHQLRQQYAQAQQAAVDLHSQFEEIAMAQREVERLASFNHTLLNRIDNIDINQNHADVRVEVISRPEASRQPVSPRLLLVLFTGCGGGIAFGLVLVYSVDVLDDRFRTPEELKSQLSTSILAIVRHLGIVAESGPDALQVHVAPDAVESEAFRTLRTTLAFSGDEMDCVAVTSSEPGDGKTTVAANLGVAIAQTGKRTLIIDADLRRPGLTRLFEKKGTMGLADLLNHQNPVSQIAPSCVYGTGPDRLDVLPSGTRPVDPTTLLTSSRFGELIAWARGHYDQIVIDSPPLLVASDAAIVGRMADGLMLVVQPKKNHRKMVVRAVEEIRSVGLNFLGVILNRLGDEDGHAYYGFGYGYGDGYGRDYELTQGTITSHGIENASGGYSHATDPQRRSA